MKRLNQKQRIIVLLAIGSLIITAEIFFRYQVQTLFANTPDQSMEISKRLDLKYPISYDEYKHNRLKAVELSASNDGYSLLVDKTKRTLTVIKSGKIIEEMPVELGANPVSAKWLEGDNATPEGIYHIKKVKDKGKTSFYRAYLMDYPSFTDIMKYLKAVITIQVKPLTGPGSLITIHGNGSHNPDQRKNWTYGCIALSNQRMDRLFDEYRLLAGTPVVIVK